MPKRKKSEIEEFINLPESEKQRILKQLDDESIEQSIARSRPLNVGERRQWRRFKKKYGTSQGG